MVSHCGRYVLSYNGEIYNYRELRKALGTQSWRGGSDAEVLLQACASWGIDATVQRLAGMYAFAVWDRDRRQLTLVRDRLGIKPLYYGTVGQQFAFASELRALYRLPGFDDRIDPDALANYLHGRFVPEPLSIFRGARKLEPGCLMTLCDGQPPRRQRYWGLGDRLSEVPRVAFDGRAAVDELDALLGTVIDQHMAADVPLGAFLSGGLDSATVTAFMQARANRPVRTFTVGFDDPAYDEAPAAAAIARAIGTDHHQVRLTGAAVLDALPSVALAYDEPFGDSAALATVLLAQAVRPQLSVVLTGDGGDEVFGGYRHYHDVPASAARLARLPAALRGLLAGLGAGTAAALTCRSVPGALARAGHALRRRAARLANADPDSLYRLAVYKVAPHHLLADGVRAACAAWYDTTLAALLPDARERMAFYDTTVGLPGRMLVKVDRATMHVGLEARVPLLDHRVVEFAWRLPAAVRFAEPKGLLRAAAARHLPMSLLTQPKRGFKVPVASWLRGPLRAWAADLLAPARLASAGHFAPQMVARYLRQHLRGDCNWHQPLWSLLMFEAWRDSLGKTAMGRGG